ncbi:unnamed protein product [Ectocarpus sp. 4 AP-2014]
MLQVSPYALERVSPDQVPSNPCVIRPWRHHVGDTGWHPSPVRKKGGTTEFQATAAAGTGHVWDQAGAVGRHRLIVSLPHFYSFVSHAYVMRGATDRSSCSCCVPSLLFFPFLLHGKRGPRQRTPTTATTCAYVPRERDRER